MRSSKTLWSNFSSEMNRSEEATFRLGPYSQGREASRLAGHPSFQVRVGHQSQDARTLGLAIPAKLLALADQMIEWWGRFCCGAGVGSWHDCDIVLCRWEFRLRPLSGRIAETPGGPGLTLTRTFVRHLAKSGHFRILGQESEFDTWGRRLDIAAIESRSMIPANEGCFSMSKQDENKAVVGRWFTEFWGKTANLGVIDEIAAPHAAQIFAA